MVRSSKWKWRQRFNQAAESLEHRLSLDRDGFVIHEVSASEVSSPYDVVAADWDHDGDTDAAVASAHFNTIQWYENVDGLGRFGPARRIAEWSPSAGHDYRFEASDLDGDGDPDLVALAVAVGAGPLVWYRNDGAGGFSSALPLADNATAVDIVDFDADGDLDLLTNSKWLRNSGGGQFEPQLLFDVAPQPSRISAQDFDNDGDLDVVMSNVAEFLTRYRNQDGKLELVETISTSLFQTELLVSDFDADGDDELIVLKQGNPAELFGNPAGSGPLHFNGPIDSLPGSMAEIGDVNGDRRPDIVTEQGWFSPLGERGRLWEVDDVSLGDFDRDGDLDVLAVDASQDLVTWYKNLDGRGTFAVQPAIAIIGTKLTEPEAVDLDADGDLDLVGFDELGATTVWFENLDGKGTMGPKTAFASLFRGTPIDVDRDGDLDLFGQQNEPSQALTGWFENLGQGKFSTTMTIWVYGWQAAHFADINGNGTLERIGGQGFGLKWFETQPQGEITRVSVVDSDLFVDGSASIVTADWDRDGDIDILWTRNDTIIYYENTNGAGAFARRHTLFSAGFERGRRETVDWDSDGDLDLIYATTGGPMWLENLNGRGQFANAKSLVSGLTFPNVVDFADDDQDGDLDVLSAEPSQSGSIRVHRNRGDGQLEAPEDVVTIAGVQSLLAADWDGDRDLDLLAGDVSANRLRWFERRALGDVNDDGHCDSQDLLAVFQAGEYEDSLTGNSTFMEGDWNGDGEFDSSDLLMLFQFGRYES